MTYPEGTRLVVFDTSGKCFDVDTTPPIPWFAKHGYTIVRESAAKCAERMLEALRNVLPLLEQGTAVIPDDDETFGFDDYEDAIVDIKALIAEAEGKDAK